MRSSLFGFAGAPVPFGQFERSQGGESPPMWTARALANLLSWFGMVAKLETRNVRRHFETRLVAASDFFKFRVYYRPKPEIRVSNPDVNSGCEIQKPERGNREHIGFAPASTVFESRMLFA